MVCWLFQLTIPSPSGLGPCACGGDWLSWLPQCQIQAWSSWSVWFLQVQGRKLLSGFAWRGRSSPWTSLAASPPHPKSTKKKIRTRSVGGGFLLLLWIHSVRRVLGYQHYILFSFYLGMARCDHGALLCTSGITLEKSPKQATVLTMQ